MDGKTIWNQVGYGAKRYRDLSDDEKKAFLEYGITMGKLSTKDLTPKEWQLLKKSPDFALKGVREGYFKDEEPKEEAKSKKESLWTKALNKITQIAAGPQETGYSRIGPINIPETKPVTDISTSDMYKTQTSIPSLTDLLKRRQEEESYPSISFGIGPITIPQDVFETEKTRQTLPEITRPTIQPDQRFSTGILGGIGDIAHKKYASYQPESQNVSEPTNIIDRVVQGDNIAEKELKEKWNMSSEFAKKHPAISKALISFASPLRKVFDQPFMARAAQKGADIATMSTTPEKELPDTGNKYTNVLADLVGTVIGYSVPIAGMGESWMGTAHKAVTPITSRFGRFIENTAFKIKPENIKQAQRLLWVKDVLPVAIESGASLSALEGLRAIADPAYEELPIKEKAKAMESSFLWGALFGTVARTAEPYMKAAWLKARGYTETKPGSGIWFKQGEGIIMEPTNFRNVKVRKEMFDQHIRKWYESKYGKNVQGITGETQTTQAEPQSGRPEQPTTAIAQIPQLKIIQNGTRYKLINMEDLKRTGGAVQVKTPDDKTISTFSTVILNGQEIPSYKVHAMIQAGMKGIDYVLADPQPVREINPLAEGFRQTDERTWVNDETKEVIIDNSVQVAEPPISPITEIQSLSLPEQIMQPENIIEQPSEVQVPQEIIPETTISPLEVTPKQEEIKKPEQVDHLLSYYQEKLPGSLASKIEGVKDWQVITEDGEKVIKGSFIDDKRIVEELARDFERAIDVDKKRAIALNQPQHIFSRKMENGIEYNITIPEIGLVKTVLEIDKEQGRWSGKINIEIRAKVEKVRGEKIKEKIKKAEKVEQKKETKEVEKIKKDEKNEKQFKEEIVNYLTNNETLKKWAETSDFNSVKIATSKLVDDYITNKINDYIDNGKKLPFDFSEYYPKNNKAFYDEVFDEAYNKIKSAERAEEKPKTKETAKESWRFTEEEIKEIPVTKAGQKALQNQNPLLNDFIRWFKEKNNGFNGFKLSTYKDGEPVFLGNGIEVSLRDYLGKKEPTKQSKPIKISEQKSEKSGTIKEEKESVRKNQTPYTQIADEVVKALSAGRKLTNQDLFEIADKYFGGTQAEGKYTSKDVYDAMELGVNKYILNTKGLSVGPLANVHSAINNLSNIEEFVLDNIPTQNRRTLETNELQQFSTPPNIAYTATWVANIYPNDVVLEPSAGVGGLAVFAKKAKADKVYVNEIAPRRIELLKELGFDKVFTENAEQLDNILPDEIKPTVILMNPPFSTAATRVKGKKNTQFIKAHIEQALKRLEPNGRLVAITGRGLAEGKPAFADWWKDIKKEYNVRANISIDGENYKKYGTQFDVQLIVIDKNGPTYGSVITDKVDTLEDAIKILEGIKRERTKLERERAKADRQDEQAVKTDREIKSSSAEHVGEEVSETSRGSARGDNTTPVSTNDVGAGTAGNETNVLPEQPTREIMAGSVDAGGRTGERNDASAVGNEPVSQIEDNAGIPDKTRAETGEKSGGRSGVSSTAVSGDRGINVKDTEKIEIQKTETKKKNDLGDSVYTPYEPQKLKIKDAKPHPGKLVQSAAMDAVLPPDPTYQPSLPKEVIEEGKLSIAQLEAVVYAGQAHEQILPDGKRKGFFIGDGTGVGKGREIAGIILDNMRQGRKKAVWISMNQDLYKDAIRDWTGIGGNREEIFNLSETSYDSPIQRESGIVYTTYATLINNSKDFIKSGEEKTESLKTRIGQLINWLGKDFDGVIAFDESHKIRNLGNKKGKFGKQKPAVTAETAELFRNSLPNARIVYVSATGATDVGDLGYLDRLGLWGRGTPFSSKNDFISKIEAGGLAAMELVARDMKAMGVYLARNLSYEGVEYSTVVHELTKEQQKVYDTLAEAWQVILQNLDKALEVTNMGENGRNRGKVYSSFWGAHQRFFNQVITSMQMPAVLKEAEKDLADGHAVVMHVDFTGEATQERLFSKIAEEGIDIEEISITPLDIVMQYIDNCFPIYQYEVVEKDGKKFVELVKDSAGNPVINKTALRIKEDLMQRVGSLRIPSNPIDMVIEAFGPKNVAEITGRSRRIVKVIDEKTGQEKHVTEKRTDKVRELEADEFMDDKRRVLIFSRKGGTGRSYHADLTCKNQRLRMHYVVQPGFSAVNAVQGFGRTHRSNQKQPPHFKLFTTNIEGQKRFISSIARKLDQLGALTKGQRQTGGQGLFSAKDNLEDELARDALERFYRHLVRGDFPDIDKSVLKRMGLDRALLDEYGNIISSAPQLRETPNFLNRVLALTVEEQNKVFTRFKEIHDKMVEAAIERGELDFGLENYAADKVEVNEERLIRTDKLTGDTFYYNLTAYHKNDILKFEEIDRHIKNNKESFLGFYQNTRSKNIRAVFKTSKTKTLSNGDIIDVYVMHGQLPHQKGYIDEKTFDKANWQPIENKLDAEKLWNDAVDKTPQYRTETLHLISGSLLPVWDRLPSGHVRVVRVLTDDGRVILGRLIKQREIEYTLTKLGAEASKKDIDINDIPNKILQDDYVFVLSNGWRLIRKKVAGEYRIEISDAGASANLFDYREQLLEDGVFAEIVGGWKTRYFIPTEPQKAKEVIQKITEYRPVIEAIPPEPKGSLASKEYYDLGDAEETAEDRGTEVKVATDKVGKKLFRRDIVNYLKEKLDIPVRFRRYRKRALGLYKNKPEEIRLKYKEDLTTLAHEVGHHIDKIIELNKETTKELIQLARERGYKKQLRQEGVAIFIEKWFTDPEEAKLIAPRYFEIFESRLADYPEIEEILKTAQADIQDFLSMPVLDRVAASISFEPKDGVRKRPINFKQWFTSLWAAWFDELEPVKYFEEILAGDKKLSIKESPFYQLWLMRGATDLARTAIEGDGIKDADYNTVFPSLREILSPVKTEKEQRMYVYYDVTMRALELYDRGFNKRAIGIEATEAELKEVRNYLETNYPHFAEVRKKHLEWRDRINIQTLVDAGLLDKATAQKIRENNQEYAPFYRVMDEESINMFTGGIGSRGRLANLPKPIKRFTGSGGTIINTLDSDIKNAFTFLNMAQRNAVMNLIIDLAEKNEGMGKYVSKVDPGLKVTKLHLSELEKALTEAGIDTKDLDLEKLITIFRPSYWASAKDNTVVVFRKGKPQLYQLDPVLYRAVMMLDKPQTSNYVKLLRPFTNLKRMSAIITPAFIFYKNPFRDIVSAMMHEGPGIVTEIPRAVLSVVNKDEMYWKLKAAKGFQADLVSGDRDYMNKTVRNIMTKTFPEKIKNVLRHPFSTARDFLEFIDEIPRVAVGMKYVKIQTKKQKQTGKTQGEILEEAAVRMRDATLDFRRAGYISKEINQIKAFFNVNLQALDRARRAFIKDRFRFIARGLLLITLPTLILYMLNRDNKYYEELPEWRKDLFFNIPINGGKRFIWIPRADLYGLVFGALVERFLRAADKHDPHAFDDFAENVKKSTLPDVIPDALLPIYEVYSNYSMFLDRPIVPEGEQYKPKPQQYGFYTSQTARKLGEMFNASPRKINHLVSGYLARWGQWGLSASDKILETIGAVEKKTKTIEPFGPVEEPITSSSNSVNQFYNILEKARIAKKKEAKDRTPEEKELVRKLSRLNSYAKMLSHLRQRRKKVEEDNTLTPEEKTKKLRDINLKYINAARRALRKEPIKE